MYKFRNLLGFAAAFVFVTCTFAQSVSTYPGVGRTATPKEVAKWDIDVRPDFKGLPPGSGTVTKGQDVWEGKCASCHGVFGESGEVFSPLIGGTTAQDVKTGRVVKLTDSTSARTTIMKVATLSTLWDYINRAMPWTQPKSLTTEEVYAVTAFLLNLGGVVPDNFTLSDKNMAEVQARMPNRNGMTTQHSMWPGKEFKGTDRADAHNVACMKDCAPEAKVASFLPDFARDAHGNLAEQNRLVGAQRGADTTKPEAKALGLAPVSAGAPKAGVPPAVKAAPAAKDSGAKNDAGVDSKMVQALLQKNNCTACHAAASKLVGPSWAEIAKKHTGKASYLAEKIKAGGAGVWGAIPMPAQTLSDAEAKTLGVWLAAGTAK